MEPGKLIYVEDGMAIMVLPDERVLFGEETMEMPGLATASVERAGEVIGEFMKGYNLFKSGASMSENDLSSVGGCGFGYSMHRATKGERWSAWRHLTKNIENLFQVHPFVEVLMVSDATGERLSRIKDNYQSIFVHLKRKLEGEPMEVEWWNPEHGARPPSSVPIVNVSKGMRSLAIPVSTTRRSEKS